MVGSRFDLSVETHRLHHEAFAGEQERTRSHQPSQRHRLFLPLFSRPHGPPRIKENFPELASKQGHQGGGPACLLQTLRITMMAPQVRPCLSLLP